MSYQNCLHLSESTESQHYRELKDAEHATYYIVSKSTLYIHTYTSIHKK